jgi:hypothetical protein
MDKMDQNFYHTHVIPPDEGSKILVCKRWENEKCPEQSDLFLDGVMHASALGKFAQWHIR